MSLESQPKLLRALETLEITPVGAARSTAVDVRLIAATNVVVDAALREGKLRGDLYARLAGIVIRTPLSRSAARTSSCSSGASSRRASPRTR